MMRSSIQKNEKGDAETSGLLMYGHFKQLSIQLLGLLCIFVWVTCWVIILAKLLDVTMGIKASLFVEDQGVKLWEYAPDLAFKLLFPSIKEDSAARLWLWSFRQFVEQGILTPKIYEILFLKLYDHC